MFCNLVSGAEVFGRSVTHRRFVMRANAKRPETLHVCPTNVRLLAFIPQYFVDVHPQVPASDPPGSQVPRPDLAYDHFELNVPALRQARHRKFVRLLSFTHRGARPPSPELDNSQLRLLSTSAAADRDEGPSQ